MTRARAAATLALLAACSSGGSARPAAAGPGGAPVPASNGRPSTRAERTNYAETSHYADVIAFVDSVAVPGTPVYRTVLGATTEGRTLPLLVISRPRVTSPAAAHASGKPIVYVQANIHAGEVEGKEALQQLVRDLLRAKSPSVLDSVVLIAVPMYNADGNEKFAPQATNRTEQNGPEMVGQRANGQGLDLNRDYVKAEAPETRASLAAFNAWDPDIFVDLHTTDGSFHGYALTYAPSLNPAAVLGGAYARDEMLPAIRVSMRARHDYLTFDYGNFAVEYGADVNTDTVKQGWFTYDARPRFGTNYVGLRGRIAILAEGYSHDPFARRVASMYWFVREILGYAAAHGPAIVAESKRADSLVTSWGTSPSSAPMIPLRSTLSRGPDLAVIAEDLVKIKSDSLSQPGVPRGLARSGHFREQVMPVWVTFEPTLSRRLPFAYAIPASDTAALRVVRLHGVKLEPLIAAAELRAQLFIVDSVRRAERPFQGHHETALVGRWRDSTVTLPAGTMLARTAQPLGVVACYLLEPESDDGLVTWNFFDPALAPGFSYPVVRIPESAAGLGGAR